jgi:phosphomannomutase
VTPEIRLFLPDEKKFATISELSAVARKKYPSQRIITIDGLRVEFADGWFLVRASNTQPALILRAEAENKKLLTGYLAELKNLLREAGIKNDG